MKKIIVLVSFVLALVIINEKSFADSITISGTYQGKNLFVKNQFLPSDSSNCITEVYINAIKIAIDLNAADYEIDLSAFKVGDKVTVVIIHKDGCLPVVLNPQVIKKK